MPNDLADDVSPRDTMAEGEFVEMLGNALVRADRDGHGRFVNAVDASDWLWQEEEGIVWDRLTDNEQTLAFEAYQRMLREHAERANDPQRG